MSFCLRARLVRGALVTAVLFCASVLSASCVGLFELDGYSGALSELCEKLKVCYGEDYYADCQAHGEPRLTAADELMRRQWLADFADSNCLESCASARACLDTPPICGPASTPCVQKEQCCGFLSGLGECGGGQCCSPLGVSCQSADDCCNGEACDNGVCGGVACLLAGDPCSDGAECCTQICHPETKTCADEICLPEGSACGDHFQCCTTYCERKGDGPGVCTPPPCIPAGQPCDASFNPELAELELGCCDDYCVTNPHTQQQVCSAGQCLPKGQDCASSSECCSGKCDPTLFRCVEDCGDAHDPCSIGCCPYATCGSSGECCRLDTAPCSNHTQCCSGVCRDFYCSSDAGCGEVGDSCGNDPTSCCTGLCSPLGHQCCGVPDCHDVCSKGGPLSTTNVCTVDSLQLSCVASICSDATLEKCCCSGWDDDCVAAVATHCSIACPAISIESMGP
jgi:hypothetical protein